MYQAIYKCRLCGKEFSDGEISENIAIPTIQSLTVSDLTIPKAGQAVCIKIIHYCQDGSIGLADFEGFKKAEG